MFGPGRSYTEDGTNRHQPCVGGDSARPATCPPHGKVGDYWRRATFHPSLNEAHYNRRKDRVWPAHVEGDKSC